MNYVVNEGNESMSSNAEDLATEHSDDASYASGRDEGNLFSWLNEEERNGYYDGCNTHRIKWSAPLHMCLICPSIDYCEDSLDKGVLQRRTGANERDGLHVCIR